MPFERHRERERAASGGQSSEEQDGTRQESPRDDRAAGFDGRRVSKRLSLRVLEAGSSDLAFQSVGREPKGLLCWTGSSTGSFAAARMQPRGGSSCAVP